MRRLTYMFLAASLLLGAAGCQSPKSRTPVSPAQPASAGDPVAPHALLYAAKSARKAGDIAAVQAALDALVKTYPDADPAIARRIRLELGLGLFESQGWQSDEAFPYLEGAEAATETAGEREQWLYATYLTSGSQGLVVAWPWHFRAWKEIGLRITPGYCNKVWMCITYDVLAAQPLVDAAATEALVAAWRADQGAPWPGVSLVGRKLLATSPWPLAEDVAAVRRVVMDNDSAIGVAASTILLPLRVREIGALIPQSGKSVRLGEALERMLALKGEATERIWLGDSTQGSKVVASLATRGVRGVVGPVDAEAHAALVPGLEAQAITSLSLSLVPEETAAQPHQFYIVHSAAARAKALARYAKRQGIAAVTVLAADTGYGKAVGEAFAAEAKTLGIETKSIAYDSKATNFGAVVAKVSKGTTGIFIADASPRIELIAPALAAAGHKAMAAGRKGGFVLMSTAEGMGPELLASAGRYLLGAVLAPGFTAAAQDETSVELLTRYRDATGKAPSALEAYAFDAVTLLQTVGADVDALALPHQKGLTGNIRFGADRRRADDGVFYVVIDDAVTGLATLKRLAN